MKIGLTYTGTPEKHANYERWLKDGKNIEVIKLSAGDNNLTAVDSCDALVLSGGIDIHPSFYGGGEDYSPGISKEGVSWQKERDEFEIKALERAWEQKKPVLGVCRGLQLINVVRGGTLVQDLGMERDERHQYHRKSDMQHGVTIEQGSLLFTISGGGGEANSAHHQAIDQLGEGLRVNCHSDDGVIEGIEWSDQGGKPFLLAVQWHPERMFINGFRDRELYMNIRNRFIEEIKKTIEQ
ncbi:MAG: hypothetical protein BGO55_05535 [Sphingobacteriales bacterium 50-39]|nr:gamma-glutamyl-gamma-aminobutyrate hydrolase family protein [Sphingobacteriales bacterium]OJW56059.1 MAG: hypothetical protein BGO55_05535 [Sphingobacteriales bacterium 50-39]